LSILSNLKIWITQYFERKGSKNGTENRQNRHVNHVTPVLERLVLRFSWELIEITEDIWGSRFRGNDMK
jgi:hypothetical protein